MSKTGIFIADGCEEIEALTVVDLLRRAGIEIITISINKTTAVTGAHGIRFVTDAVFEETDFNTLDGIILPGGMPGTTNLGAHDGINRIVREFDQKGLLVSAICAAPTVLAAAGILNGRHATCYPGMENQLTGAIVSVDGVVKDEHIITSRGMGTAIDFGLAIVEYFNGTSAADTLAAQIVHG